MSGTGSIGGGVAAGHAETARAAAETLRAGGNAFDAALAGFLAACVAEPVLASLGGGGFLMAGTGDGHVEAFDFFTQTPRRRPTADSVDFRPIVADFGTATQDFHIGLGAVATPGAVAGVFAVHRALGRLPMAEIARPALALARDGVRVDAFQAYLLNVVGPIYVSTPESVARFCRPDGGTGTAALLGAGDVYRAPDYADFLDALVRDGPALFYEGEVAARIAAMPGIAIDAGDLAGYRVERRRPWTAEIAGHQVAINPPPAIGGALIGLALTLLDRRAQDDEAARLRALVGVMAACNRLRRDSGIDRDPAAGAAALRDAARHPPAYRGTTHVSVADGDGNLAAVTVSNGEGCGHLIPGTGVMLNNMLGEEDLNAAGFFAWPEDVRLSSMMAPALVRGPDDTRIALGSGGSNRIRSALTQVIDNVARRGMRLSDAVEAPRLHLEGDLLSVEPGFAEQSLAAVADLVGRTEVWPAPNMFFGGAHAVATRNGRVVDGAGDPRRDGVFLRV